MKTLVIGSRASRLALWQSGWVKERIEKAGYAARIEVIRTSGDRIQDRPLASFGGKGIFVKEIEDALLAGTIDLAVHSLKDLPTEQPDGLHLACVPEREDPRDLLVLKTGNGPEDLPTGAVVGTGSPRRACQIRALRPDVVTRELRGNIDTRIRKLEQAEYDAIILATAGVRRLGFTVRGVPFEFDQMLPAVGQGALGIETRADDTVPASLLERIQHRPTAIAVAAERSFLRGLGGGCQAPIASIGLVEGERLTLRGLVGDPVSGVTLRDRVEGTANDPAGLGVSLAERLLNLGAGEMVARAATPQPDTP